jgi:hypothetical protein
MWCTLNDDPVLAAFLEPAHDENAHLWMDGWPVMLCCESTE